MKPITALALLLAIPGTAWTDEVRLKNGGRIVGIVREEGDRIVAEVNIGTVRIAKSEVDTIAYDKTPLHEYSERRAKIEGSRNASDYFDLAVWAKSKELTRYMTPLLEHVIALEPDHAAAHALLGHVFHENRWMTQMEHLKALGFVEFRGKMVKPEERDATLAAEAAARQAEKAEREERRRERARAAEEAVRLDAYTRAKGASCTYSGVIGLPIAPQIVILPRCIPWNHFRHMRRDGPGRHVIRPNHDRLRRDTCLSENHSMSEMEKSAVPDELPSQRGLFPEMSQGRVD